jgi:hypothetical protein
MEMPRDGHFATHKQPDVSVLGIRQFLLQSSIGATTHVQEKIDELQDS